MEDDDDVISHEESEQEDEEIEEQGETPESEDDESEDAESDEVVVTIGEEAPASEEQEVESAPAWVKNLRKENRELARKNREYEKRLSAPVEPAKVTLPPKPKLSDFEYDEDAYDVARDNWEKTKRQVDAQQEKDREEQRLQQEEWQASQAAYLKARTELKVKDFEDAEEFAKSALTEIQQGILVEAAKNAALVVYAIGKSPEKAKQLASIKNPIKFAVAIAELEKELKVTTRKAPPPPEKAVRGNMPVTTTDSKLAALEKEADKTGDRSKLVAYKRQLKLKAA